MSSIRNLIIIGSGPAGYTAAIYAARANLKPLMISGLEVGGQLMTTTEVENYPGFPKGIMGPEMMQHFREQALRFGTEIKDTNVTEVDFKNKPFTVKTADETLQAHAVIVSTGASARWLNLPGELELRTGGKGLTACATCDGFFYRGKEVVVMGGGDSAMEEANFLTKFCTKVTIVNRRNEFRASKIMLQRAKDNPKIALKTPYAIAGYKTGGEGGKIDGVVLEHSETKKKEDFPAAGVFMAIGHIPNTQFLKGQLKTDEGGYILTGPMADGKPTPGTRTSIEGVFACGDCQDHIYRQAVTAAGSGCSAAIDAERWLAKQGLAH
ncbi:MAG: thioredoxin-disulfide reductase [Planctomycetaceae bacterium]|nr:thioredoxin-disulfide reductase [Planctomycetaceae bacterium]